MSDSRPVVVGCNGSSDTDDALRFATEEARLRETHLLIVCAYFRPVEPDLEDFDLPDAQLRARALSRAQAALRRALDLPPSADLAGFQFVAVEGDPGHVLIEQAGDAAMIVLGSHERPVLRRLFRHQTSEHLLHDGHVPVTVVPRVRR
jgi:nucleotide-binding universal stress UspA family protein